MEEGGNHPFAGQFADTPTDPGWLAALPPRMRLDVITNNLIPLVEAGSITRNLRNCLDVLPQLPLLTGGSASLPGTDPVRRARRTLRGSPRPDCAAAARQDGIQRPPVSASSPSWKAGTPMPALREAQKRFRKTCGKRKANLPGLGGLCFALA